RDLVRWRHRDTARIEHLNMARDIHLPPSRAGVILDDKGKIDDLSRPQPQTAKWRPVFILRHDRTHYPQRGLCLGRAGRCDAPPRRHNPAGSEGRGSEKRHVEAILRAGSEAPSARWTPAGLLYRLPERPRYSLSRGHRSAADQP